MNGVSVPFFVGVLDALVRSFGDRLVAADDLERIRAAAQGLQAVYSACPADPHAEPPAEKREGDE